MKKLTFQCCSLILCLAMVVLLLPLKAQAAVAIDTDARCSLDLDFTPEDIKCSGVEFRLYKVAEVTFACEFVVDDTFADQPVTDLLQQPDAGVYSLVSSTLSGVIAADPTITPDDSAITDERGIASFRNLEPGLYLAEGDVYHGNEYFYIPLTTMICIPERLEGDVWNYEITAEVKWGKRIDSEPVNIQVIKTWSDSAEDLHEDDPIKVELYKNGTLYDTQYLKKENNWNYTWNALYGGAVWTVKESPIEGYTSTVERQGDCFIITNTKNTPPEDPPVIPDTGLLWWPVPLLLVVGGLFFLVGLHLRKKGKANETL